MEKDFTIPKLATMLDLDVSELVANWAPEGVIKEFARKFLEGHAWKFAKEEKWESCVTVLSLLSYGIVLFPNIDNFIDHLAV